MIILKSGRSKWVEEQLEMSKYIGMRKHRSQFTQLELNSITSRLKSIERWKLCHHALDRMRERQINVTYDDVVSTIHNCKVFEYKIDYHKKTNRCQERVGVLGNAVINHCYNLNVVYNLSNSQIVSAWLTRVDDLHYTLDWSLYNKDMKVFGLYEDNLKVK